MGVTQVEAITSSLEAHTNLLWPVPASWSLEDAATVPLAYSMAFYILVSSLTVINMYFSQYILYLLSYARHETSFVIMIYCTCPVLQHL